MVTGQALKEIGTNKGLFVFCDHQKEEGRVEGSFHS